MTGDFFKEYAKIGDELDSGIYEFFDFNNYLIISKAIEENRKLTKKELSQMKLQQWAGEILESERLEKEKMEMQ
jgi:hypothetical protein